MVEGAIVASRFPGLIAIRTDSDPYGFGPVLGMTSVPFVCNSVEFNKRI